MKKLTTLFLLALLPLMASAYDAEVDGIYYKLNAETKEAEVASGDAKYTGSVVIPETFTYGSITYSVTSIGYYAFNKCESLTSITIPKSVKTIGNSAFSDCYSLKYVNITDLAAWCRINFTEMTSNPLYYAHNLYFNGSEIKDMVIPGSVTSIGAYAFYGFSGLTSVTIPNSVTSIGRDAFSNCSKLTSVHITDLAAWCRIKFITTSSQYRYSSNPLDNAQHLYMNGAEITDLVIPNGVTSIGCGAFSNCTGLKSVTIPSSVTTIERGSFCSCSNLESVTIPNSVTSIEDGAFEYCSGVVTINMGNSVTTIGNNAFAYCSNLVSVNIPNSVTSIGYNAFNSCSSLVSVTVPDNVQSIDGSAFSGCSKLMSVSIGSGLKSLSGNIFGGTNSIASIKVSTENNVYDSRNNCNAIIETSTNTLISGCKNTVIPNSVTSIGSWAFYGSNGLTSVTIPNSVESIGNYAFSSCYGLTSVTIPNSVESIGNYAFSYCYGLTDIYCYGRDVPTTGSSIFSNVRIANVTLYVPEASIEAYKTTSPWSGFGTIKTMSGETPEIPETPKCATPAISFVDGKLRFSCDTEDVEYVYNVTPPSYIAGTGTDISISTTYKVTVYATKKGYDNSDVATKEINVGGAGTGGVRGDVNLDGEVGMPDVMYIVNYILNGKFPEE